MKKSSNPDPDDFAWAHRTENDIGKARVQVARKRRGLPPVPARPRKPSWLVRFYAQVIAPLIAAVIVLTPVGAAYWAVSPGGPYRAWFVQEFQVHVAPAHQTGSADSGSGSTSNLHLQKD